MAQNSSAMASKAFAGSTTLIWKSRNIAVDLLFELVLPPKRLEIFSSKGQAKEGILKTRIGSVTRGKLAELIVAILAALPADNQPTQLPCSIDLPSVESPLLVRPLVTPRPLRKKAPLFALPGMIDSPAAPFHVACFNSTSTTLITAASTMLIRESPAPKCSEQTPAPLEQELLRNLKAFVTNELIEKLLVSHNSTTIQWYSELTVDSIISLRPVVVVPLIPAIIFVLWCWRDVWSGIK
jgi:hypothetical protein